MARRAVKKRSRPTKGVRIAMPREVRAAYGEIQKGVAHLDGSIAEIRTGLRRAERKIEMDARRRISDLRKEARAQMRALQGKQREASRTLKKLSAAAGESWREVKRSADSILSDARATAATVAQRFRTALRA
jgi:hypothetical protein